MGFFGELFGPSEIEKKVDGYFNGTKSRYECCRLCIRDHISRPQQSRIVNPSEINDIVSRLRLHTDDNLAIRFLIHAALLRSAHPFPVNLIYTARGPVIWVDKGVTLNKSERELRFMLMNNKRIDAFAWLSLYDDGTRISPSVPGVDDTAGWSILIQG